MRYLSTRQGADTNGASFVDTILTGLAPDGGLYVPATVPDVRTCLGRWQHLSYTELAAEIMALYISDMTPEEIHDLIARSYAGFDHPLTAPVVPLGDVHILELFHGPTLAFKDYALQFLGRAFEYALARRGGQLNVLAATSGDTGAAAIAGVRARPGIRIFVMHPKGGISSLQQLQMTTILDDNVHNLAIKGTFDDCQEIMKSVFNDLEFKRQYSLGAVNSVNWARVLAQIVYYFYAYFQVCRVEKLGRQVRFSVPTGNFGNIFAGYLAARMGLPIACLILATNANDVLARFFCSGDYVRGRVQPTLAPAMDVQAPSNFERYLYYRYAGDSAALKRFLERWQTSGRARIPPGEGGVDPLFAASAATETEILETIEGAWKEHQYLLDPHTATGVAAARKTPSQTPTICLATAHPAKFPGALGSAVDSASASHKSLASLVDLPQRQTIMPAEREHVMAYLRLHISARGGTPVGKFGPS